MSKSDTAAQYDTYRKVALCLAYFSRNVSNEAGLYLAVICQAIQDAMGLYKATEEKVYLTKSGESIGKRKYITRQQEAQMWFKRGEHYMFCDVIGLDDVLVDKLLITKCGIKL